MTLCGMSGLSGARTEVGRLVPELTGGIPNSDLRAASAESRFRLYDSVSAFLRRISEGLIGHVKDTKRAFVTQKSFA